jgi:hypothetical protein
MKEVQSCPHHAHPHAHSRWLPRLDAFGSAASLVCALHCAFLPLAAALLPLAAVELLGNHEFEWGFVTFALLFGALVLGTGLSRTNRYRVMGLFFIAMVALLVGVSMHGQALAHAIWMVLGGLSLGSAHALNRHSVRTNGDAQSLWKWWQERRPVVSAGEAID